MNSLSHILLDYNNINFETRPDYRFFYVDQKCRVSITFGMVYLRIYSYRMRGYYADYVIDHYFCYINHFPYIRKGILILGECFADYSLYRLFLQKTMNRKELHRKLETSHKILQEL